MEIQPTQGAVISDRQPGGRRPLPQIKKRQPKNKDSNSQPTSVYMPDGHVEEKAPPKIDLLV